MPRHRDLLYRLCAAIAVLVLALPGLSQAADEETGDVRVMSFNIRYGTAQDGENHWDRRRERVVETIRAFDPDLLGTQETLGFQRDFLAERMPGHEVLGVGRQDGRADGEMAALYYRKERFVRLDAGHYWLSTTPDVPGSKSWDSSLPRMVTWVKLRDARRPGAQPILFFNTHFDHRGEQARLESARLMRQRASDVASTCAIIVTGDFNAGEGSPPYQALFDPADSNGKAPLIDTFRRAHSERTGSEGTFSGFSPTATSNARIDWIAVSRDFRVVSAGIDRTVRDGRTPSDHFPVTATVSR